MSNIEPTEEQKQEALEIVWIVAPMALTAHVERVARLLAEREAKLREEWKRQAATNFGFAVTLDKEVTKLRDEVTRLEALCTEEARLIVERDTLRARVAELEAQSVRLDQLLRDEKLRHTKAAMSLHRSSEREAQHILDIKAATSLLGELLEQYREFGGIRDATHAKAKTEYARLARYDDAKDAEGGAR